MPQEFSRARRVSDLIQRELADVITRELRDPRLSDVTISEVQLSRDLARAKVYVMLHEESDIEGTLRALRKATGFLRHRLSQRIHLRGVPQLRFAYDANQENAARLSALIDSVSAPDEGGVRTFGNSAPQTGGFVA